jgi:hypothetical protein
VKAISSRYLSATRTLPARIKAFDADGNSATVEYDGGMGPIAHWPAVLRLCTKMQWYGRLIPGGVRGGYVWVWQEQDDASGRTVSRPGVVERPLARDVDGGRA